MGEGFELSYEELRDPEIRKILRKTAGPQVAMIMKAVDKKDPSMGNRLKLEVFRKARLAIKRYRAKRRPHMVSGSPTLEGFLD